MGKHLSRKNAFAKLGKYTLERQVLREGESRSPAETALLDALTMSNRVRKALKRCGDNMGKAEERAHKELKFIAASLGILPSKEQFPELERAMKVRFRMKTKVFSMFVTHGYWKGSKIYIREIAPDEGHIFEQVEEKEKEGVK